MNLLDPRLDKALEQAEISASFRSLFGRKDKPLEGLNQLIAGPMASGKTFQAHEYIAQMHDVGLITNPKPYLIDCSNAQPWAMGKDIKDVTEGSIIVFDDLTDSVAGRQDFRTIVSTIVAATEKAAIIVLGDENALTKAQEEDPGMARRFPSLITLDKSFSPAEQAAFEAGRQRNPRTPRPSLSQRREAEKYEKMMEELRTAKGDAFRLKRAIKPVNTVRFTAPKAGR